MTPSEEPVAFARRFLREAFPTAPAHEPAASELRLALLTGSAVRPELPEPNDLDLLLFVPQDVLAAHDVPPIDVVEFEGMPVEVCTFGVPKLRRAAERKHELHLYWQGEVVRAAAPEYADLAAAAGRLTPGELRAALWTDYCSFRVNRLAGQDRADDPLTTRLECDDCVALYVRAKLRTDGVHVPFKWQGPLLRERDRRAYERAIAGDLDAMQRDFETLLADHGFSNEEIERWDRTNAELLFTVG